MLGIFLILHYFDFNPSGLFILSSKTISPTKLNSDIAANKNISKTSNLNPYVVKENNLNKLNSELIKQISDKHCSDKITNLLNINKKRKNFSPVLCEDYGDRIDIAYFLNTKVLGYDYPLKGCVSFEDECLDHKKVLDRACKTYVRYDDLELAFYRNVKQEFIDLNANADWDLSKLQPYIEQGIISEDDVYKLVAFIIDEPRKSFILLGETKLKEIMKKTIEEQALINTISECDIGDICKNAQCESSPLNVDLYVGNISTNVRSDNCKNTFEFEVCNKGDDISYKTFEIKLSANGVSKTIVYYPNEFGAINPGQCTLVSNDYTNIIYFDLGLSQSIELTVELDSKNKVSETNEANNKKTGSVYTGDDYFNNNVVCESWCFDADADKEYLLDQYTKKAIGIYKLNGALHHGNDFCDILNPLILREYYCYPNTSSNLFIFNFKEINCNDLAKELGQDYGFCNNGACEFHNFEDDAAAGGIDLCLLKNIEANRLKIYPYCEYFENGVSHVLSEDYTDVKENKCFDEKTSLKWICENDYSWHFTKLSGFCPIGKVENSTNVYSETVVCNTYCDPFTGKCAYNEDVTETCIDSDGDSPETPGYVTIETSVEINEDGVITHKHYTNKYSDSCSKNGDTLEEVVCIGNKHEYKSYNNLFEQNKSCKDVNGSAVIVDLDDGLKYCEEFDDAGLDTHTRGKIEYRTNTGEIETVYDYCVGDDSKVLIEYFCGGNEPKFQTITCNNGCMDGVCQ